MTGDEAVYLDEAADLARSLGIAFSASGAASEPGLSLKKADDGSPWSLCRRPWSLMYFTANGRALPCCIAPFSSHGYENYTLGDATKQSLQDIWNGPAYQAFRAALLSDRPPATCANCGLRWSVEAGLASCRINPPMPGVTEIVSAVIPCLDEEDAIGAVVSVVLAQGVAVPAINISKPGFADGYRFLQHGRKHRLKIAGRAADDLRHFRGRGSAASLAVRIALGS